MSIFRSAGVCTRIALALSLPLYPAYDCQQWFSQEFNERAQEEGDVPCDDLIGLVKDIVPFHMTHNGETDAVDLLMETNQLKMLQTVGFPLVLSLLTTKRCSFLHVL